MKRKTLPRLAGLARRIRPAWADQRGVAAIEFALFAMFLSVAIINVADVSIYIYQRMRSLHHAWICSGETVPLASGLSWMNATGT